MLEFIRRMHLDLIDLIYEILMKGLTHLEDRRKDVWILWDAARQLADDRKTVA